MDLLSRQQWDLFSPGQGSWPFVGGCWWIRLLQQKRPLEALNAYISNFHHFLFLCLPLFTFLLHNYSCSMNYFEIFVSLTQISKCNLFHGLPQMTTVSDTCIFKVSNRIKEKVVWVGQSVIVEYKYCHRIQTAIKDRFLSTGVLEASHSQKNVRFLSIGIAKCDNDDKDDVNNSLNTLNLCMWQALF